MISVKSYGLENSSRILSFESFSDVRQFSYLPNFIVSTPYGTIFFYSLTTQGVRIDGDNALNQIALLNLTTLRIQNLIKSLQISKTFAAKIFNVSRTTIYDWLAGKTTTMSEDHEEKIKWIEKVSELLSSDEKNNLNIFRHRRVGPHNKTIEEILCEGTELPEQVAAWIEEAFSAPQKRSAFGSWKKSKKIEPLTEIPEAYLNND